ncbi:MAG: biosynthetic-type acetolactate synthase large subunit [Armatimonadota bacterium]|nr:biosynthetic-type acetolactate synthase large subunit [Armatimonadota bacterium]MDR7450012.1 biosynthetic-type acetolactate synthase large subunit [Armatimonadota bacterium]MDR7460191.1 biosynthetic-type acetolactate synthase large subunit [Armatimonadota bacterium]MDR7480726.1 biosynthetic-type acetolactate synthase large subunit [Armatimonadota bacterium]MDR7488928.1 biosynthetic-type acetolactate synthase large subunit [Armatimonadota bacterium]
MATSAVQATPTGSGREVAVRIGAQVLVETLRRLGVTAIFGHPGGAALPIYDALYDARDIAHVLVRHEQVAAHAAVGYARATGRVGVCLATSGPGATNLVTGLTDAYMDSIPVVAITAQVPTAVIGRDAFQEADIIGLTLPITKHSYLVRDPADLPAALTEAFAVAASGRPGPVVVDVPRDVSQTPLAATRGEPAPSRRAGPRAPHAGQIAAAAALLRDARRPVIYAGGGVISAGASVELTRLVDQTGVPVTVTLMGKGAIDEHHPRCLGMLGMHGTVCANYAVDAADVVLAVGVRFDDRVTGRLRDFAPQARFIHIDIDPAEIGKNKPAHVPIVADARAALGALADALPDPLPLEAWWRQLEEWQARYPLRYRQGDDVIKPQFVCETLARLTGDRAVVVTDVGQHQMWAAQFCRPRAPRTFISSGGLGAMGFGFPAALGAQVARPDATVVALVGDGGFQMTMQDLITAVEWRLPVKVVVLNNGSLGMVRQWQEFFYRQRYSHVFLRNPDFARLAEVFGAQGRSVRRPDEVEAALAWMLAVPDGPCVLDVHVDPQENCLPMIPSGQSVKEMILG